MKIKTRNYENLVELVKTNGAAVKIEAVAALPHTYIERARLLIGDFIGQYLDTEQGLKTLSYDIQTSPDVLLAKIESIAEHIRIGEQMLSECCEYKPE